MSRENRQRCTEQSISDTAPHIYKISMLHGRRVQIESIGFAPNERRTEVNHVSEIAQVTRSGLVSLFCLGEWQSVKGVHSAGHGCGDAHHAVIFGSST